MADNQISVVFEATASTGAAEAQMAKLGASTDATMQGVAKNLNATAGNMRKTLAQSSKEQNISLEHTRQIYAQLGLSGTQANEDIARAFGTTRSW